MAMGFTVLLLALGMTCFTLEVFRHRVNKLEHKNISLEERYQAALRRAEVAESKCLELNLTNISAKEGYVREVKKLHADRDELTKRLLSSQINLQK